MYHPRDDTLVITPWPIYYLQIKTIPNNTEVLHISCSCCCVYTFTINFLFNHIIYFATLSSLTKNYCHNYKRNACQNHRNNSILLHKKPSKSKTFSNQFIVQYRNSFDIYSVEKMTYTKTVAIKFRVYVTAHLPLNIDRYYFVATCFFLLLYLR